MSQSDNLIDQKITVPLLDTLLGTIYKRRLKRKGGVGFEKRGVWGNHMSHPSEAFIYENEGR